MNENPKKWRIASMITAIISEENKTVALINSEDQKAVTNCKRAILCPKLIEMQDDPVFEIKLETNNKEFDFSDNENHAGFLVYIKNNQLGDWYELRNFYFPHLSQLILENNIGENNQLYNDNGDFDVFYPIISSSSQYQEVVSFASDNMSKFLDYNSESLRRLNVEIKKKTKKWIPGHRYDSVTETLFYLGKVNTIFDLKSKSTAFENDYLYEAYLVTDSPKVAKTGNIEDILKTYPLLDPTTTLGEGIKLLPSIPSEYVDSGEVIKNNVDNFNDLKPILFENTKKYYLEHGELANQLCVLLQILQMSDEKIQTDDLSKYQESVISILATAFCSILYESWDIKSNISGLSSRLIGSFKSTSENISAMIKELLYLIRDGNTQRGTYYPDLFEKGLGIDIKQIAEEVLNLWAPTELTNTVEGILKHKEYLRKRSIGTATLTLSTVKLTSNESTQQVRSIKEVYGNDELYQELIDLIRNTINGESTPCNIEDYKLTNNKLYKVYVTIDDIINYENNELSQALKDDIVKHQFCSLILWIDAGKQPE